MLDVHPKTYIKITGSVQFLCFIPTFQQNLGLIALGKGKQGFTAITVLQIICYSKLTPQETHINLYAYNMALFITLISHINRSRTVNFVGKNVIETELKYCGVCLSCIPLDC